MREWIELTDFGRYGLVWQKTLATYREWMAAEGWDKKDVIDVPRVQQYTFKVRFPRAVSAVLRSVPHL